MRYTPSFRSGALLLALVATPVAAAPTLTRGPYLQLLGPRSVTIVWNTSGSASCVLAIGPVGGATTLLNGGSGTVCAIAVNNLQPGTEYTYVPRAGTTALRGASIFRTDDPDLPFTFLVIGDSGGGGTHQYGVAKRMKSMPADFIVHTGDMIYESGAPGEFNPTFFAPYKDLIRELVFWPCLGNHDVVTSGGAPWRAAFYTPANNPARSENYYSFDHGNVHVVVLDSNASTSKGSPQYVFLDRDLEATTATWKVVSFHHTIYSSGTPSDTRIRANLVPLFDKHGVDFVFMGHSHHYERTKPLRDNKVVQPGLGTVYVTTGGGGESVRGVGQSSFTAAAVGNAFHFVRVAVDHEDLLLEMIREDGAIKDSLRLSKVTGPRCGDGVLNRGEEQCDGLDAVACPGRCLEECRCDVTPTTVALAPHDDTYVEGGSEATWVHGGADNLDVDASPLGITYLKFDLSTVTGTLDRAVLELRVTNPSPDGGRVFRLADTDWVEGTATGANSGAGLRWNDIDTNRDNVIDTRDTSPLVPQRGTVVATLGAVAQGTIAVDVTAAFRDGPGPRTLAIMTTATDGTAFASSEHATASLRPVLRVTTH